MFYNSVVPLFRVDFRQAGRERVSKGVGDLVSCLCSEANGGGDSCPERGA